MNHTKEPWRVESGDFRALRIFGQDRYITSLISNSEANAKRIVACVNACAGITNEALEAGIVGDVLRNYMQDSNHIGEVEIFYDLPLMEDV